MRSLRWGRDAAVYVEGVKPGELVEAEVLVDDGVGEVEVRLLATREVVKVPFARLARRAVAAQPPPGRGGHDVAPLHFGDRKNPGPDHREPWRWRGWREGPERK
jgi:hypothetical protein